MPFNHLPLPYIREGHSIVSAGMGSPTNHANSIDYLISSANFANNVPPHLLDQVNLKELLETYIEWHGIRLPGPEDKIAPADQQAPSITAVMLALTALIEREPVKT